MALRDELKKIHNYLPTLAQQVSEGQLDRREFLRTATLLGLSAGAAYSIAGLPGAGTFIRPAHAASTGGTVRLSMRVRRNYSIADANNSRHRRRCVFSVDRTEPKPV